MVNDCLEEGFAGLRQRQTACGQDINGVSSTAAIWDTHSASLHSRDESRGDLHRCGEEEDMQT